MKNPFGAKITQSVDNSMQPFLVVFDKTQSLESRQKDAFIASQNCQQTFYIDQGFNFLMAIANRAQADKIKKLQTVLTVGGINIDFERFQQIITGKF